MANMDSSTVGSTDGLMPIETYVLRRDHYHKSYPLLLEHPYHDILQGAPSTLAFAHKLMASTNLVEKTLDRLNIKFNECHCFSRHKPDAKSHTRYPIISISAVGHPDHFVIAAKSIWKQVGMLRRDEFMERLVVEIYDPACLTSRARFDIPASVAVESGLSPLPSKLQDLRKQVTGWLQFTPCLMYAHCSAGTEADEPIPTLLVRCLHNKTADYGLLEDDIFALLPKVQVIFEAIPPLLSDEAIVRTEKQLANRLDSDLWTIRQRSTGTFAKYLNTMFRHPSFPFLTDAQQRFHILDKMNNKYTDYVFTHTPNVPGLPLPSLEALIYLGSELDAQIKHPGESESMSYHLFFLHQRRNLLHMATQANDAAADEMENPESPEAVDLGLDCSEEMVWLEYYTRFRTPAVEMRYEQRLHRLEKSATAAAVAALKESPSISTPEAWKTNHPRTHFPSSLSSRQWAIPSTGRVLGTLELPFPLNLQQVTDQEEEDTWSAIDAAEADGEEAEEKSTVDEMVDWVKESVWFDTARKTAGRVVLGKEWRKWSR